MPEPYTGPIRVPLPAQAQPLVVPAEPGATWQPFTFYYGQETGYRATINGTEYEIIPTNGRTGSWDLFENGEWDGETFSSVEDAKAWVES